MPFDLATLVKCSKPYAADPSCSDEEFLNALLEPYVIAGRVVGRGGCDYHLDKHRTSRILSGKVDVPKALRKVWLRHGLEDAVVRECGALFDGVIDPALMGDLQADVLSRLGGSPKERALRSKLESAKADGCSFMAAVLVGAIGMDNRRRNAAELWRHGSRSLSWVAGDLLDYGFANRRRTPNLVAVPVDRSFCTKVTRRYEGTAVSGVSERTLHGQWLARMQATGINEEALRARIDIELQRNGACENASDLPPIGTVVPIETERAAFLLVAVSDMGDDGVARATGDDIATAVGSLLSWHDRMGQGATLYLPLVGTGMSRAGLGYGESFELICKAVMGASSYVSGSVVIVLEEAAVGSLGLLAD